MDTALLMGGPANVYVNTGTLVAAGIVINGVRARRDIGTFPLKDDRFGDAPVNKIITRSEFSVSFDFAEYDLTLLKQILIGVVALADDVDPLKKRLEFRDLVGKSLLSLAKEWVFKPIDGETETTDKKRWLTLPKGCPDEGTMEWVYSVGTQQVFPVTLYAFPELVGTKYRRAFFGDATAVDTNESGF